jgi:hypothetical protein
MQIVVGAKAQVTAKGKAEATARAAATAKADAPPLVGVFNRPQRDVRVASTKPYYSKPGNTLNPKYPMTLLSLKTLNPKTLETLNPFIRAGPLTPSFRPSSSAPYACLRLAPRQRRQHTGCSMNVP